MMNRFLAILIFIFISGRINCQIKLTIEELFTKPGLSPKGISGIQWINGTERYAMPDEKTGEYLLVFNMKNSIPDTMIRAKYILPGLTKIPAIKWIDADRFYFNQDNTFYLFNTSKKAVEKTLEYEKNAENIDFDPNSFSVAYTIGNNLFLKKSSVLKQITREKDSNIISGKSVHREEFGITKGTFWSPGGRMLAFYRMDQTMVTDYPLVELGSFPARNNPIKYPMAGQVSHYVTLGIYNQENDNTLFLKTGTPADQYLTNISWTPDEKHILIAIVNREQNFMKLNMYSAETGDFEKTLFTESDSQWVEPLHSAVFIPGKPDQFIWQSERSGTNQLYLYNLNGKLVAQVTKGNQPVTRYLGSDYSGKVFFTELSTNNGLNRHLVRSGLDGKVQPITREEGTHFVQLSDSKKYFIDQFSSLLKPLSISLVNISGASVRNLLDVADPIGNYDLPKPELIQVKASDGTILNGRIFKPLGLQPDVKYPVLVYVYGGPHVQLVSNRWLGGSNLWLSWMASQGYVVFTLDNRGSADRGQSFAEVIHRRLGQIEMEDQLAGLTYLKSLPYVDSSRFGIHGWSFGGFMTTSLMCKNPGLFKAGVCGGPVIDWKMYEVMYTERYMDTPVENKEGYEKTSLLNYAENLKDRLLMIHGTSDDVVVWQHGQEFVKKCVEKGSLIDYMIYPGHGHNVQGKDRLHLFRTITRYFQDNL